MFDFQTPYSGIFFHLSTSYRHILTFSKNAKMEHHTIEKSHSRAPLLRTQPAHRRTKNRFSNRMINDGNFRATGRSSWTRYMPAAAVSTCTSDTLLRTIFRVTIHRLFKVGKFSLPRTDFPFSRIRGYQHRLHYATIKARKFAV